MPMITETTLLAEREITERLLDYGRGVDRLDAELLSSVWHVGATADYGEARLRGPVGAVTDELLREHRARTFHHHNLTEPLVRIEGERAVSESNVIVIRRWRPQGQWRWMDEQTCLRFLDRWSRRGGRWAIDHRLALTEIAWQQPVAQAAVGQLAQRDRTDPVYAHFAGFERVGVDGEQGLAMLRAERDIRRQLSTYSRGVDRFDPDVWKAAWHSDATFGYEGEIDGRAHDMAFVMTFGHYKWVAHSHMSMRPAIRVRDDTAVSETLNFAVLHGYRDTTGRSVQDHFRGRYLDRWEKRDGRWAIARRFNPRGGKWQQTVDSEVGTLMRRDRSDPSYALFASLARGSEEDDRALLTAEHAVRTQLQSGVRALDRLDADLYGSLWWPEGRLQDRERGVDGVARDVIDGELASLRDAACSVHLLTNSMIDMAGDRAVSHTGFHRILAGPADATAVAIDRHLRGRYLDRWSRRDGRWALMHREIVRDFAWQQLVTRRTASVAGRRDRADPSYDLFTEEFALPDGR